MYIVRSNTIWILYKYLWTYELCKMISLTFFWMHFPTRPKFDWKDCRLLAKWKSQPIWGNVLWEKHLTPHVRCRFIFICVFFFYYFPNYPPPPLFPFFVCGCRPSPFLFAVSLFSALTLVLSSLDRRLPLALYFRMFEYSCYFKNKPSFLHKIRTSALGAFVCVCFMYVCTSHICHSRVCECARTDVAINK